MQRGRLDEAQHARSTAEQALAASNTELQSLQKIHTNLQSQHRATREEASKAQAESEAAVTQAESWAADLAVLQRVHEIVKGELDDAKTSKSPRCDDIAISSQDLS